jgi:hypothetical protein
MVQTKFETDKLFNINAYLKFKNQRDCLPCYNTCAFHYPHSRPHTHNPDMYMHLSMILGPLWQSCGCNGKMTSLVKLKPFSKVFGKMAVVVTSLYFSCHMWGRSCGKPLFLASPPKYKLQNGFSITSGWKPFFG